MKKTFPARSCLALTGSGLALTLLASASGTLAQAQTNAPAPTRRLSIDTAKPGISISPSLYGLMTEEINYSYDGGLYGELIRNRAFKDDAKVPVHWSLVNSAGTMGSIALDTGQPIAGTTLTNALRLEIGSLGTGEAVARRVGVANEGYWGIPVRPNTKYRVSFYAKASANLTGPLTVALESTDGANVLAQAKVASVGPQWRAYSVTLKTGKIALSKTNRFVISASTPGTLWLSEVSLFPPTYKNRPNGNRIDLMEKMAAMQPSYLRFPGGNYLEGNTIAERFDWKKTLGPLEQRPGHHSPWGYRSTDGTGLLEFLHWCEDLKMQPVLAVFAGYALGGEHVTGEALQPFVQDALDEIEYVSGGVNTPWGARRAADGHPAPFGLKYVEIGNEDWFDKSGSYDSRYAQFHDAIKAKYPQLQLIATMPVKSRTPDVYDEHFYASAASMVRKVHDYDTRNRQDPKIFVGEWASQDIDAPWSSPGGKGPTPSLNSALGDAVYMTGLERNSDVVVMQCYAPLLVNVNPGGRQWAVNLIGYDALGSFGSPSYYAQVMFSSNRGDVVLPVNLAAPATPQMAIRPMGKIGVGTYKTQAQFKDAEVTQNGAVLYHSDFSGGTANWQLGNGDWKSEDNTLSQSGDKPDSLATFGETTWGDYTYTVKARKTGGAEGFLIPFHLQDKANFVWLNLGGWGNTQHGLEKSRDGDRQIIGSRVPGHIETGRWYDIKIEVQGTAIRCSLDGKLILEAQDSFSDQETIYSTASRDNANGDVILKVVNIGAQMQPLQIDLQGIKKVGATVKGQVMSGAPSDHNSLENPEKVAPQPLKLKLSGSQLQQNFPAYSVSVLRFKTR